MTKRRPEMVVSLRLPEGATRADIALAAACAEEYRAHFYDERAGRTPISSAVVYTNGTDRSPWAVSVYRTRGGGIVAHLTWREPERAP